MSSIYYRGLKIDINVRGFVMKASSSIESSVASCSPATSFAYSSCNFAASVFLILPQDKYMAAQREAAYSSIFSPSLPTLRAAESNIGRVRSILNDSMQTLSQRRVRMRVLGY
jgi:hypothetical protein